MNHLSLRLGSRRNNLVGAPLGGAVLVFFLALLAATPLEATQRTGCIPLDVEFQSVSTNRSKVGPIWFSPNLPPTWYLVKTKHYYQYMDDGANSTYESTDDETTVETWDPDNWGPPAPWAIVYSGTITKTGSSPSLNCSGSYASDGSNTCDTWDTGSVNTRINNTTWEDNDWHTNSVTSVGFTNLTTSGMTGEYRETCALSAAYTTAEMLLRMKTNLNTLFGSASWSPNGYAYFDMDTDESSADEGAMKYHFKIQTKINTNYRIEWDEMTVYGDGSAPSYATLSEVIQGDGTYKTGQLHTRFPPTSKTCSIYVVNYAAEDLSSPCISKCSASSTTAGGYSEAPGAGGASLGNGPEFALSLGRTAYGQSAGQLRMSSSTAGSDLATPDLLAYSGLDGSAEVITNVSGVILQVKTDQALADVVSTNVYSYTVNFYSTNNIGTKSGGLYSTNGTPYLTWKIQNPDTSTNNNRLYAYEIRGSKTITNLFTWVAASNRWDYLSGNNLRLDRFIRQYVVVGGVGKVIETRDLCDPATTNLLSRKVSTFEETSWGLALVDEKVGNDPSTTYTYYSDGKLDTVTRPDGSTEENVYDGTTGKLIKTLVGYQNTGVGAGEYAVRTTYYDYTSQETGDTVTLEPNTPRKTTEKLLDNIVSLRYTVVKSGERKEKQAQWPHATYSRSDNRLTDTLLYTTGSFINWPLSVLNPDGTKQVYFYSTNSTQFVTTILSGEKDGSNATNILSGTKTVKTVGTTGQPLVTQTFDIASGILTSSQTFTNFDVFNRPQTVIYLDGTTEGFSYDCCNLSTQTNREGVVTSYVYDDLKRVQSLYQNGIYRINNYDAAGQLLSVVRQGTDASQITLQRMAYDLQGRMTQQINAVGETNLFSQGIDGSGQTIKTNVFPDLSTRIETYAKDGSLLEVWGTGAHRTQYTYGIEDSGDIDPTDSSALYASFVKTIKPDASGNQYEWVKSYTDVVGRPFITQYSYPTTPYPTTRSTYNSVGQLSKETDRDGVNTLYEYNARGELEYTIQDTNGNQSKDTAGTDRIRQTVSDVVTNSTWLANVRRTRTFVWDTDSVNSSNLLSTVEVSVDGLRSWQTAWDGANSLVSKSQTAYASTNRYVTNTAPDGSIVLNQYQNGLALSTTRKDSAGTQIGKTTYGYDAHGRQTSATDARNGTTSFALDNLDRIITTTTPMPGTGQAAQATTSYFDNMGRIWKVVQPDSATVTNEFFATGELKKVSGARTYPVEYTYDNQGRMLTMKTWKSFASNTGSAVTTWAYDAATGLPTSKLYADSKGPTYTYTLAGRLSTRLWYRGVTTTYTYNGLGELSTTAYSGSGVTDPTVTLTYDRLGRKKTAAIASGTTTTWTYNGFGQVLKESYSGGTLTGLAVTNTYDSYARRASTMVLSNSATLNSYTYDNASRLASVSDGTYSANYTYLANSPLVSQILFKQSTTTRLTTTKQYDYLNRLQQINSQPAASDQLPWLYAYAYNDANQRTRVVNADGAYSVYRYDTLGQVTSGKKYFADGTPMPGQQSEYAYDDIGNRTSSKAGGDETGNSSNLRSVPYVSNNLNQYTSRTNVAKIDVLGITSVGDTLTVNASSSGIYRKGQYFRKELSVTANTYPGVSVIASSGGSSSTNAGSVFIPPATEAYTYDDDGNLTQDGRWDYTWDAENRLIQMQSKSGFPTGSQLKLNFEYDTQGRRIRKRVYVAGSGTASTDILFLYDGWNLLAELDNLNSQTLVRSYLWGNDLSGSIQGAGGVGGLLKVAQLYGTTSHNFAAYDGNGNVVGLIDNGGTTSANYEFDPFGQTIRASGSLGTNGVFRFSSKYQDLESDLIYYGYRYYKANAGTWCSRDPIAERGGVNIYGIANNDALSNIDPTGLIVGSFKVIFSQKNPKPWYFFTVGWSVRIEWRPPNNHIWRMCPPCLQAVWVQTWSRYERGHLGSFQEGPKKDWDESDYTGASSLWDSGAWPRGHKLDFSEMWDDPERGPTYKFTYYHFSATASLKCIAGKDAGKIYGNYDWGFTYDPRFIVKVTGGVFVGPY